MQKEKLAIIGLVIIVVVVLSALIVIVYGGDIFKNLFEQEQISAKDDTIVCYRNKENYINKILSNDKFINISSYEDQIKIITSPIHGVINIKDNKIFYTPTTDFLGSDSFVYQIIDQNGKTSKANVKINVEIPKVEIGDCVDVYYVGRFTNGTVFDTNIEEIAKASGIFNESKQYVIANVFVDPDFELYPPEGYDENYSSEFIKGFLNGLIGMEEGEKKNITIPPEEAYGSWNESLAEEFGMGSIPLDNVIQSNMTENIQDFSMYYPDVNISEGVTFDYGEIAFGIKGIMNATILNVTDTDVTYKLIVENGTTIKLPFFNWNATFIVVNDDSAFTMHSDLKVNHTFSYQEYWMSIHFKVVDVNETHAKLAVNMEAPSIEFVDETLVFELEVVNIYKTSTQLES
ncbi:MAG: FKBP-type peptidyl-prolyl cis-trans isomerase [Thermoplasmatota archaeon]|jgi:FKBP-type peptidyl-prolyl cis-trans isomerase 2